MGTSGWLRSELEFQVPLGPTEVAAPLLKASAPPPPLLEDQTRPLSRGLAPSGTPPPALPPGHRVCMTHPGSATQEVLACQGAESIQQFQ